MTIASEITRIQNGVASAYSSVSTKGGTLPATQNLNNLPSAIESIPSGITPTGNKSITASTSTQTGIDVTNYATVSVAPTPTETKSITANGTYTPTSGKYFSQVTVNAPSIPTGVGHMTVGSGSSYSHGTVTSVVYNSNFTIVTGANNTQYQFYNMASFLGRTNLVFLDATTSTVDCQFHTLLKSQTACKTVYFTNLTSVSGNGTFYQAFKDSTVENIYFTALTTVSDSGNKTYGQFQEFCTGNSAIKSITFSELTTIISPNSPYNNPPFKHAFNGSSNLKSVNFPKLRKLQGNSSASDGYHLYEFIKATGVETISFDALTDLTTTYVGMAGAFIDATHLKHAFFPALTSSSFAATTTNYFSAMLAGVTGCTLHFPSNLSSLIGSFPQIIAGCGGTNTVVLFDLDATS